MWKLCLSWNEKKTEITAKLPEADLGSELVRKELDAVIAEMEGAELYLDDAEVVRFLNCARERKAEAYDGIVIAKRLNAQLDIELTDNDMLASMKVTGAYGGRGLRGSEIVHALAQARVTKGINKLALKKVLVVSNQLKAGEEFVQPVAQGKQPIKGKDAQFVPLVEDITKRVLKPEKGKSANAKIDMRNLGATITVDKGDEVMRREPATKGTPGFTVQGKIIPPQAGKDALLKPGKGTEIAIPPQAGKDALLKPGKGTEIASYDPNLLIASQSGMPLIKEKTIEVASPRRH